MLTLVIIEGLVILLLTVLVAGLLRSHADILRKLDALGLGEDSGWESAPAGAAGAPVRHDHVPAQTAITGVHPGGGAQVISLVDTRGFVLLAFLSTGCSTCQVFWQGFDAGMDLPRLDIRPVIVTKGPTEESPSEVARMAPAGVTTVMSSEAWDAFRVPGTPYFQLIDGGAGRVVGEGSAGSWPRLVDLLRRALGETTHPGSHVRLDRSTRERMEDTDEELRRAGIKPGDPRLYQKEDRE